MVASSAVGLDGRLHRLPVARLSARSSFWKGRSSARRWMVLLSIPSDACLCAARDQRPRPDAGQLRRGCPMSSAFDDLPAHHHGHHHDPMLLKKGHPALLDERPDAARCQAGSAWSARLSRCASCRCARTSRRRKAGASRSRPAPRSRTMPERLHRGGRRHGRDHRAASSATSW